jgi:hypothetical protein
MRRDGARPPAATLTMLALVVLVGGCAVVQPKPWDRQANSGPLQVFGADPTSPGQQVFQALLREPSLEALLGREGEPDTLEVVGTRLKPKQILLVYVRRGGRPHRIVLDSAKDGFVARAPEPLAIPTPAAKRVRVPAQSRKKVREPGAVRENEPSGEPTPTARQQLECPIDATRSDCQALCRPGAPYEWCH